MEKPEIVEFNTVSSGFLHFHLLHTGAQSAHTYTQTLRERERERERERDHVLVYVCMCVCVIEREIPFVFQAVNNPATNNN